MPRASFLRRLLGARQDNVSRGTQDLGTLCEALLGEPAEFAGAALAREALAAYEALQPAQRNEFFDVLARAYSPSPRAVGEAADAYRLDPSAQNFIRLQEACEPPRQELFRRLNMAPGGTPALVEMRKVLLRSLDAHPEWSVIDSDLRHLLRSWFNRGFLRLERIDWRTSAAVLEKIIQYEAVHAIQGWRDLRRRLAADRRCFAFFHPQLPDEPIIFIEVALTRGMSAHVQPLLDVASPVTSAEAADCAMFYSITNCQEGLRGISFGNLLIKQVAAELKRELPQLTRFATLSPIPGFRRWLAQTGVRIGMGRRGNERLELLSLLQQPGWHTGDVPAEMKDLLASLCAYYLVHARQGGEALDPVARFHLANGASLERLNWMGDTSEQGLSRSAGLMVNYLYELDAVEKNHARYFQEQVVVASPAVEKLAEASPLAALDRGAA